MSLTFNVFVCVIAFDSSFGSERIASLSPLLDLITQYLAVLVLIVTFFNLVQIFRFNAYQKGYSILICFGLALSVVFNLLSQPYIGFACIVLALILMRYRTAIFNKWYAQKLKNLHLQMTSEQTENLPDDHKEQIQKAISHLEQKMKKYQ
ncbi:hypothetical protein A3715_10310 [Oleiphilus sp. HI0009]|nr:hypothetical protein A3715_10310 [Oleiphilus sp. HI0009]